jgi:hypothetical protein
MKPFVKILILALAGSAAWVASADQGSAMLLNQGDKIWDAFSSQGNLVLKGKYKESPENGMIEQTLEFEFQHVAPGTRVTFAVDGTNVRSATANAAGVARARFFRLVAPGPDGRPTGPRVETGSILTASWNGQTMTATFQPRP